jgi:hypothetical protein
VVAEDLDGVVGDGGDGERGEDGGDDGEQRDGKTLLTERFEVEEKGSGEEEQREHSVEDEALEVDLVEDVERPLMGAGPDGGQQDQGDGGDGGEQHGADGVRQAQDAGAYPAEEGRDSDEDADQQKHSCRITGSAVPAAWQFHLQRRAGVLLELWPETERRFL